ncbi:MAG: hypothetical protein OEY36_03675 [Gammaproteobacteria bacterium]|nr:hypothetical protein [Gammaproteobacteria bacterium]
MASSIITIARFSLLEAMRGKILWFVMLLLLLALSFSLFISQAALTETRESEAAIIAGFLRLASILMMIFFVVASIARDFQDKSIELLFSVNIPRNQVFLGKFAGFSALAFVIAGIFFCGLLWFANSYSVFIWSLSLWCELTLMALIALVFILSLENVTLSLLASIGIYGLMRFMPAIQSIGDGPFQGGLFNRVINSVLDSIDFILPRLEHFSQSSWLVYGGPEATTIISFGVEFLLFCTLLCLAGIIELKRKSL